MPATLPPTDSLASTDEKPAGPAKTNPVRVAVLGGGITGLTAAWHLREAGLAPVVFEKSARVGGAIGAHREGEWLHELGPNSLLEGSAELGVFIDRLGLADRRLYAREEAKKRYIVRGGQPVAMPASPGTFVTTKLFSARAKLGLALEPFRPRGDAAADESVGDFVVRRLGQEFLDYAINPFVGGVYAGDPRRLSVRHGFPKLFALEQEHGSLLRGAFARRNTSGGPKGRIFSFPLGLGELPQRLAALLGGAVRLDTGVTRLRRRDAGWEVEFRDGNGTRVETFDAVVAALPADALAALEIEGVAASARLATLREIEHPPVASVFTGFRREDVAHPLDGFGVLVPEVEGGKILGTLFSSSMFPGRAPEGHVAVTTFVGGVRQPELARLAPEELLRLVRTELERLLGVRAAPVFSHVAQWPRAIPQYTVGYQRHKDTFAAFEAAAPGFYIGGNARDGISLANCIESGRRLARVVTERPAR